MALFRVFRRKSRPLEAIGDRRLYLLVMEKFIPVIWSGLTQPNATTKQVASGYAGLLHIEAFMDWAKRASRRWGVHLRFDVGWEDSHNQHSHVIVSVLAEDFERFQKRASRFDPNRAWRWKGGPDVYWKKWDPSRGGWSYTTEKHTHLVHYECPVRANRCRQGRCEHLPKVED